MAPESHVFYESDAVFLYGNDELAETEVALKECLQIFPSSEICTVYLAKTYHLSGTSREQQESTKECYIKFPQNLKCQYFMTRLRMSQGNYKEAILIFK
jgi:hypothetical protein